MPVSVVAGALRKSLRAAGFLSFASDVRLQTSDQSAFPLIRDEPFFYAALRLHHVSRSMQHVKAQRLPDYVPLLQEPSLSGRMNIRNELRFTKSEKNIQVQMF